MKSKKKIDSSDVSLKQRIDDVLKISGHYVKTHNTFLILASLAILIGNIVFTLVWFFSQDVVPQETEIVFHIFQTLFLLASIASITLLAFARFKQFSDLSIAIAHHAYATFLVIWSTVVFCFDLNIGFPPLTYLIISTFIAGMFVIIPYYFILIEIIAFGPIAFVLANKPELLFGGEYFEENIVLFMTFLVLIAIVCIRNYSVILNDHLIKEKLHEMSYVDELTGLLNERSYIDAIEDIDNRIDKGEDVKFAVILMDVNNLKATNDEYGHRYGCHLIVRCGHTLPTIFKTSKLFHVGGDEFIIIVMGEDLENFDETMKRFDDTMLYSVIKYEEKELIFSVARGYHIREKNQHFKNVLQIADKEMYENKKYLKEKYNFKGR